MNWVRLLPIAKLAYRTLVYVIIGKTPFFINKGFQANIILHKGVYEEIISNTDI